MYEVIYNFSLATPTIWVESSHANNSKREKVLDELLQTEENYVEDLHSVLYGYRDRLDEAGEDLRQKSEEIFGNMEEIFDFHSQVR